MRNLRRSPRNLVELVATIRLGPGATRRCLITNISAEGICFNVKDLDELDEFELSFTHPTELARNGMYKVVWRDGTVGGAKFVSTPLPA
jgi:PilZ domain